MTNNSNKEKDKEPSSNSNATTTEKKVVGELPLSLDEIKKREALGKGGTLFPDFDRIISD